VPNPVVHFEIICPDDSALQNFYRELFDWKIDSNNEWNYVVVEKGGDNGIAGGIAGNQDGAAGSRVTVYAAVDDLQAYLDKAERLGANVVMPVTEMSGTGMAISARS
jgi:predicted enzyme related to lactoylglutathione lyase